MPFHRSKRDLRVLGILLGLLLVFVIGATLKAGNFTKPAGPSKPMVTYSDAHLDPYKDRPELDSPNSSSNDLVTWQGDSSLAYTSFTVSTAQCGYGAGCLGIIVETKNGCTSRLYGEIELLDGSDTNIGFSNDLLGHVGAGKRAKLVFHLTDSELSQAKNWNVTKISCS